MSFLEMEFLAMRGHNSSDPIVGATVRHLPTGNLGVVPMPEAGAPVNVGRTDVRFQGSSQPESIKDFDLELVEPSPYAASPRVGMARSWRR